MHPFPCDSVPKSQYSFFLLNVNSLFFFLLFFSFYINIFILFKWLAIFYRRSWSSNHARSYFWKRSFFLRFSGKIMLGLIFRLCLIFGVGLVLRASRKILLDLTLVLGLILGESQILWASRKIILCLIFRFGLIFEEKRYIWIKKIILK